MEHPVKVATPLIAAVGVQVRAPGPPVAGVPPVIESVTVEGSPATVLPPASWTVTTGGVVKAAPPVAPAGEVVTASWLATPVPTPKDALVAVKVSPASVAVSV